MKNHKYAEDHMMICKSQMKSQNKITSFFKEDEEEEKNEEITEFEKRIIVLFISCNIALSQIEKSYFIKF